VNDIETKCAYCGEEQENPRRHSGVIECGSCWNWRKILGPQAKYWMSGIEGLFHNDFGFGPDPNDYMEWNRWGIDKEVENALIVLKKLQKRYEEEAQKRNVWTCECGHMRYRHNKDEGTITTERYTYCLQLIPYTPTEAEIASGEAVPCNTSCECKEYKIRMIEEK
jgi:hypothetical protein